MSCPPRHPARRDFLRAGAGALLAAGLPSARAAAPARNARVAIVTCRGYGPEVKAALDRSFDQLGGLGPLVGGKTVTIKLNLSGSNFTPLFGRPVGESYITHPATVMALDRKSVV